MDTDGKDTDQLDQALENLEQDPAGNIKITNLRVKVSTMYSWRVQCMPRKKFPHIKLMFHPLKFADLKSFI